MVMTRYGSRCERCGLAADLIGSAAECHADGSYVMLCGGCQPDPGPYEVLAALLIGMAFGAAGWLWLTQ